MNIHIPTPLRAYTGGQQTVSVPGTTVGEALEHLTGAYPELRQHLYTGEEFLDKIAKKESVITPT